MAESKIPKEKDTRVALAGNTKIARFASDGADGNAVTLRWLINDDDYFELRADSTGLLYRKRINGTITTIWTK